MQFAWVSLLTSLRTSLRAFPFCCYYPAGALAFRPPCRAPWEADCCCCYCPFVQKRPPPAPRRLAPSLIFALALSSLLTASSRPSSIYASGRGGELRCLGLQQYGCQDIPLDAQNSARVCEIQRFSSSQAKSYHLLARLLPGPKLLPTPFSRPFRTVSCTCPILISRLFSHG